MSGVAFFVTAALSFFLTPYVIRKLGNSSYGVLLMASEVYGYYGLLDFGIRGAVGYYVAKLLAEKNPAEAAATVRTAFWTLMAIAAMALPVAAGIAWVFPMFMNVGGVDASEVRLSVGTLLAVFALNLPGSVPDAVLVGLRRFDVSYGIRILTTVFGAVAVAVVLSLGGGLFEVALAQSSATVMSWLLQAYRLQSLGFGLPVWPPRADTSRLPDMFRYGGANLIANIAQIVMLQSDVLVLGRIASATAVSYFQIGRYLSVNMLSLIGAAAMTLGPSFTHRKAAADTAGIRTLALNSSRTLGGVTCLITAGILVFGPSFIALWAGSEYLRGEWWHRSDSVLTLMTLAMFCRCIAAPFVQYMTGTRQMRFVTGVRVGEAVVNLGAAIVLARDFGIAGVALAKLCVSAASQLGLMLPVGMVRSGVLFSDYVKRVLLPCGVVAGATAVPALLIRSFHVPDRWPAFFAEVGLAGASGAAAMWAVAITAEQRSLLLGQARAAARKLPMVRTAS
jgi:O-antigen/teichoic acid export membrane protein